MSSPIFTTTSEEFAHASLKYDIVPVHAVIDSPNISPLAAFRELRTAGEPSFISESVSPEVGASRYSYVCLSIEKVVRTGKSEILGDINPLSNLRSQFANRNVAPVDELPALVTGAFGFVSYEAVQHFEPSVGELPADPTESPVSAMAIPRELLVFDNALNQLHIIAFASKSQSFESAHNRTYQIAESLDATTISEISNEKSLSHQFETASKMSSPKRTQYPEMVRRAREEIIDGELIQVVLSQHLTIETKADAIDIYEQLSEMNPSPYMYMLDLVDMQLIGASPELLLRSTNGTAAVHPIAGTRPRGATAQEDLQNEADLLSNEKESAEHVMLVDLARNDLGRVSKPGTVKVTSLKHVERYSHVMHLVSRVEGKLVDDKDGMDAFESGFPIGTLSGAPKIRSIQLIAELEPEGRGPYCGGIGWFAPNGDVDTGTIIRSVVLRNGDAHVQGGAGIVFDSDPDAENLETIQKAKAPLLAIARAEATQDNYWRSDDQPSPEIQHPATMQLISD
ncbi:MAG: chorismate-binding protein [Dehalococcoidia bacterium]|nr:chorismate-binding protein [Dehalococcoidia bacterium]